MKRLYFLIRCSLLIGLLTATSQKGYNQCLVDWTTSNYFCDLDSLYLTAVPVEGVPPFSFIWETGETTQTIIIPLALGDYMLTMTDANGCISIINCHVKPFPQVLYYPYNQNACEGDTVTLFLEWFRDSIPGATYLWSTGATTPTITLTDDLIWSVTVTDPSNGCEFIIPPGLFDFHPTPVPEIVGPSFICNGGTITLSVTGGPFGGIVWYEEGIWEGTWSNTFDVTHAGTYVVWGNSPEANYCWNQDTIVITEGNMPPPVLVGPPELCSGQTGTITITNSSQYTNFNWSNGATTSSINANNPGTYTVTVSDGECESSASLTIDAGSGPDVVLDATGTTCGESNGAIDLTPTPLQGNTYAWSNGATTQDISNITAGSYTVTVTDANGCTTIAMETILDTPIPINVNANVIPNNSCVNFNGAINITVSPSGEPYTYSWSNGATTEDIIDLLPGIYTVTVTTGANCIETETYEVDDLSGAAEIMSSVIPASCGENNGSISIQLNGGQGPFTYLWSNGHTTEGLNDIPAGTYTVTVTGSDGCVTITTIPVLSQDPVIAITGIVTPNTSCDANNGEIDVTVNPTESYTFNWSNGSTSEDLIGLSAGQYELTVTLGNTCVQTATFTVTNQNLPFTIAGLSVDNTSCNTPNGSIDVSISPPGAYTFIWSNGSSQEDQLNLSGGSYTVTVTSADGCMVDTTFVVNDQTIAFALTAVTSNNTSCAISNGAIDLNVSPAGSYSFQWSNGLTMEDLSGLSQGSYTVTVTDQNLCTSTATYVVGSNTISPTVSGIVTNALCNDSNGAIDLTTTPAGSTFLWSNGALTEDLVNIPTGTYSITVTGPDGCVTSDTFDVLNTNNNFTLSATVTDNNSCTAPAGSINLTVIPTGAYTFNWSTGASTEDLQDLDAGTYEVIVTDVAGCSSTASFTVQSNTVDPLISGSVTPSTCGQSNGAVALNITPSTGNSFIWSNGSTNQNLPSVVAGSYSVTVTSANGCSASMSFVIPDQNSNFTVTGNTVDNTSCVAGNGGINLNLNPSGIYSFAWSNGATSEDLQNVSAGNYAVTVTDEFSCSATLNFTILDQLVDPVLAFNVIPANCGQSNGAIDLTVTLTAGNTFLWSNGQATEDLSNITPGSYSVTVTSADGCTKEAVIDVPNLNSNFTLSAGITDNESCVNASGSINLTVMPPGTYTYAWSNGNNTEDLNNIPSGIYEVTVTDIFNCATSEIYSVEDATSLPLLSQIITSATCGGTNGRIDLTLTPSSGNSFLWSTGDVSEDIQNLSPGNYSVTVTDANGCTVTGEYLIPGSKPVEIIIDADLSALNVDGTVACSLEINVPLSSLDSIIWSPDAMMSCHDPLCIEQVFVIEQLTQVSVMVMDTNGCFGTASLLLDIDKEFKVYIPNVFTPNGDGPNDMFTVYANEEVEEVVILEIFDRWGNNVFVNETFPPNDPSYGWDGIFKDKLMNPAVFAYRAVVRLSNGDERAYKGDVTLVR